MRDDLLVGLTEDPLDPAAALAFTAASEAGGHVLFVGTVRDEGGSVEALEYEAYEELAIRRLQEIGDDLFARWPVRRAALLHRTGRVEAGEPSVLVAVACPHRAEAFEAARHAIDRLKGEVPIWKRELAASGERRWVS